MVLNGYYLGHFGDMTIDDIAAGIRWHYERGTNALADDDTLTQARADIEAAAQAIRTLADFLGETLDNFILRRAPPKWRHYALHAKRARVRKKYRNRIRRAFFAALASEGGGSS